MGVLGEHFGVEIGVWPDRHSEYRAEGEEFVWRALRGSITGAESGCISDTRTRHRNGDWGDGEGVWCLDWVFVAQGLRAFDVHGFAYEHRDSQESSSATRCGTRVCPNRARG